MAVPEDPQRTAHAEVERPQGPGERPVIAPVDRPATPAAALVDTAFTTDTEVRQVYSQHLSGRVGTAIPDSRRAIAAFTTFRPSRLTERGQGYVSPGEDIEHAKTQAVLDGANRLRTDSRRQGLRVELTDDFTRRLTVTEEGASQTIRVPVLLDLLQAQFQATVTARDSAALTECAAEAKAQELLDQIEGNTPAPAPGADGKAGDGKAGDGKAGDGGPPAEDGGDGFVAEHVKALLAKVTSPDEPLNLVTPAAGGNPDPQNFELRKGPADVTSYHDFNSLQIAFDHVWAEVFDDRLAQSGRDFYHAYVGLLDFVGVPRDADGNPLGPDGQPLKPVTSIDDILALMQDASMLSQITAAATPPVPSTDLAELTDAYTQARQSAYSDLRSALLGNPGAISDIVDTNAGLLVDRDLSVLKAKIDEITARSSDATQDAAVQATLPAVHRLDTLLEELRDLLAAPYSFVVYQEGSCNFGIMVTYRQTWEPQEYQVGDLVSTIPLAPKEIRRYTTKKVTKTSRVRKEIANNLNSFRTDNDTTGRADQDIVDRAENRTNFKATADGTFGVDADKIHATVDQGKDSAKISEDTKKDFHEAVLKSAREYRQENRTEVETSTSEENETTTFAEIQNPNDELTVTYLFYELQRSYLVSERIQQVTPVVLVANKVPAPHEIDDAWLLKNDWILRRVLLDDSFRPALEYLAASFVGDELNLQILDNNVKQQRTVVDTVRLQVAAQSSVVDAAQRDLNLKMDAKGGLEFTEGILGTVKDVFDPFHLTGDSVTGTKEGMDTVANYAQQSLDRAERQKAWLLDQLSINTTALQAAVDKLAAATTEHYNKIAGIDRLRVHVKENILYYMQAIWSHEPPDQRYFRVFELTAPVPVPVAGALDVDAPVRPHGSVADGLRQRQTAHVTIPLPEVDVKPRPLVEIADLDDVLGYKGNYAIYRLKENNPVTLHMMQDYMELTDVLQLRDPDDFANYTVAEMQELARCLFQNHRSVYDDNKLGNQIKQWMLDRLASGRAEDDRVIVPSTSLYIEALVGTHPLLEDFKLLHRALDVKKVQSEVRHAELENVRLAARALGNVLDDPDVERKIVIEGTVPPVTVQPDA
jgi:hypothetical protein